MEVAESSEAWAIRRIRWAVDCYRSEGVRATRTDVLTRARVSAKFKTLQSILAAAEEGARSLRAFLRETDYCHNLQYLNFYLPFLWSYFGG
jgi:hypothetical protein